MTFLRSVKSQNGSNRSFDQCLVIDSHPKVHYGRENGLFWKKVELEIFSDFLNLPLILESGKKFWGVLKRSLESAASSGRENLFFWNWAFREIDPTSESCLPPWSHFFKNLGTVRYAEWKGIVPRLQNGKEHFSRSNGAKVMEV